ncbi:MAG: mobile mystery protein B [Betaproteobacteria bacterium]|nr:mobile mystery protein B [Betaproteobacteria bacterium]
MGLKLDYPPGATPLDPDEAQGLIPRHISTQGQLNEWEQQNILRAEEWVFSRRRGDVLTVDFIKRLHQRMFDQTWRWAGAFRRSDKNIGVDWREIEVELRKLCLDVKAQLETRSVPLDEAAARFHHRMTRIHPFANGNGRHARLVTDVFLVRNGADRFSWGSADLEKAGDARTRYIAALRAADARDYSLLLKFVRS